MFSWRLLLAVPVTVTILFFAATTSAYYSSSASNATGALGVIQGQSVVWQTVINGSLCVRCHFGRTYLDNPSVNVQYGVRVINDATGELIPANSTVPKGTIVRFEFVPHTSEDVYWFGTGHFSSSPYGDWVTSRKYGSDDANTVPTELGGSLHNICLNHKNYITTFNDGGTLYGSLSINPPVKQINGLSGLSCTPISSSGAPVSGVGGVGGGLRCVMDQAGTSTAAFVFESTSGRFYMASGVSISSPPALCEVGGEGQTYYGALYMDGTPFLLNVPQQSISYPIVVSDVEEAGNTPPMQPNISSGAACIVGQPNSISFSTTDSDGDNVRYGIDWDADGSVDQFVPPTGYVSSGTTQTASRTYSVTGAKTVKIFAQDSNGLSSGWATASLECADPPPPSGDCPVGYVLQSTQCVFSACPTGYTLQGTQCVQKICSVGYALQGGECVFSACPSGYTLQGTQCVQTDFCLAGYVLQGTQCVPINTAQVSDPDLSIRAIPSRVRVGQTTRINWSANNVIEGSCTVSAPNGDFWGTDASIIGGNPSRPITQETTYTLLCLDLAGEPTAPKKARVRVTPTWREF